MREAAAEACAMLDIAGEKFKLNSGNLYLLGRKGTELSAKLDIALESDSLDTKHAILEFWNGSVIVIDLQSKMGTYLDNQRLESMKKITINSTSTLRFGEVEGQVSVPPEESDDSSGFHEGAKNIAENNSNILEQSANVSGFLGGNSTRHSFTIPETQFVKPSPRASTSSRDVSLNSTNEDFFIPETQEMVPPTIRCSQKPMVSNPNISKNIFETDEGESESAESQFRICTQDYNENCFGEEVDLDSWDSSRDVRCSLVIPHIQHKPVLLAEKISDEESVQKESESAIDMPETSKCTTLNESKVDNEDDRATPDILDFSEVADENVGSIEIDSSTKNADETVFNSKIGVPHVEALSSGKRLDFRTQSKSADPVPLDEEEDLMPTQVFMPRQKKQDKAVVEFTQEYLTLSDKENMLPSAAAAMLDIEVEETQATQIYEGPSTARSEGSCSTKMKKAPNANADKKPEEPSAQQDDENLPCTQVFPLLKKKKTEASTSQSKAKNGLSSSLPSTADQDVRNAASSFEVAEKTPHKAIEEFKKPGSGSLVKKTSSVRSDTFDSESMEMMMCTPQLLKDEIFEFTTAAKNVIEVNKTLFGDDSDEDNKEDDDVLNLITNPQVSLDFHKLVPNLKANLQAHQPQALERKINFLAFSGEKTTKALNKSKTCNRSRDERHAARSEASGKDKSDDRLAASTSRNRRRVENKEKSEDQLARKKMKKTDDEMVVDQKKQNPDDEMVVPKKKERKDQLAAKNNENPDQEIKVNKKKKNPDDEMVAKKKESKDLLASKKNENLDDAMVISKNKEKPNDQSSSSRNRKRKIPVESETEIKQNSSRNKESELPAKRITRLRSRVEVSDKSNEVETVANETEMKPNSSRNKESELLAKRITRLRSHVEEESMVEKSNGIETKNKTTHNESDEESSSHKKTKAISTRCTRLRSHAESQDNESNNRSDKNKTKEDLTTKNENIRKRLRSTSSRSGDLSSIKLKVSMTTVDPELFERLAKKSSDIWTIANDPIESDILVMDQGVRTFKFLMAMAKGIPIVTSKWLKSVNQNKCIVSMKEHFFADANFEKRHKFSLIKSLEKARKRKLLEGFEFLLTADICPIPSEMRAIINCSGGKVHADTPAYKDNQKLYLISSAKDKKYWHEYRRINSNISIISTEGLMTAVIRQRVEQLDKYLLG